MGTQLTKPNGPMTVREEFGATQYQPQHETAATAVAAREQAQTQARYIVAMQRPRNMEMVRTKLLAECDRVGFAEVARYSKPVGSKKVGDDWVQQFASGFSIRFAEAALRCIGNVYPDASVIHESDEQRIVRFTITDLESNLTYASEAVFPKTVERKKLKQGQDAIGQRTNSKNETVFIVAATDDEVSMKQASAWSKFIRNGLRFVPGDILDECEARIGKTLEKQDAADPNAAKRRMIDAFNALGIPPVDLQMYLGRSLDGQFQPAEFAELRAVYSAIKDGETTWQAVLDAKQPSGSDEAAQAVGKLKFEKLKKEAEAKTAPPTEVKPAEEQPKSEQQTTAPTGLFANEDQQMTLMTLAGDAGVAQVDLKKILVKFGVLSGKLQEIPLDIFPAIIADLKGETAPRTEEPKPATKGLKFGEKAK